MLNVTMLEYNLFLFIIYITIHKFYDCNVKSFEKICIIIRIAETMLNYSIQEIIYLDFSIFIF